MLANTPVPEEPCYDLNGSAYVDTGDTAEINGQFGGTDASYDVSGTGAFSNEWRFTGEQRDSDSGLYYLRARYYDPGTGRFMSQDPLPSGNLYAYVGNNPLNFVDPSGLCDPQNPLCKILGHCYFLFSGSCLHAAEEAQPYIETFERYAVECAIWGGAAYITTVFNPGSAVAGSATAVASQLVTDFLSGDSLTQCLVWGAGAFTVERIAVKAALSSITAAKTTVAGCVSGAGSWFLNKEGLSNTKSQCVLTGQYLPRLPPIAGKGC